MTPADLVAVASIGSSLQILTRLHEQQGAVRTALSAFSATDGTAFAAVDASTAATDEAAPAATDDSATVDASAQELDTFNNDVRLRALKTLAEALQPIQQKKAIIYFSSGMQRSGTDNQVELRAAVNAAVRANVAIYPVDSRGLQAIVPGGSARQGSRGGVGAFSGRGVAEQFTQLAAQQETLTVARVRHRRHGVHRHQRLRRGVHQGRSATSRRTTSSASRAPTPTKDGRFRRITVRLAERSGAAGSRRGTATTPTATSRTPRRTDREVQLQEQLATPIPGDRRAAVRDRRMVPARRRQVLRADLAGRARVAVPRVERQGDARRRRLHPRRARLAGRPDPRHADRAARERGRRSPRDRCSTRPA